MLAGHSTMNYTAEQHDAIYTHDHNLIVIAGAGSGKTRVLVDRFVALLEAHPDWTLPSLVAITFTEKAAREMRDRVRQAIETRIAEAVQASPLQADRIAFWRTHQAALDSARIGTIHGLCAMLIRGNAAYLGIDPGFEQLDDMDAAIMQDAAIEDAMRKLTTTNAIHLFSAYDTTVIRDTLRVMLNNTARVDPLDSTTVLASWQTLYAQAKADAIDRLRVDADFMADLAWTPDPLPPADDVLTPAWFAVRDLYAAIATDQAYDALTAFVAAKVSVQGGKASNWGGDAALKATKAVITNVRDHAKAIVSNLAKRDESKEREAAELVPLWAEAIQTARATYGQLKTEAHALDFNDLEALARDLLQIEEVRERYRGREIQHVLVDEFQDTNAAQRDIVYALSGLDRHGSLFVVGDPKQSIYAFRGADVSVFEQVRRDITAAGGREILLSRSFRSHSALIGGLNAIFAPRMIKQNEYAVDYVPMVAERASVDPHDPALHVTLINEEYITDKAQRNVETYRRWEAHALAQNIQDLIESPWQVWDKAANEYRAAQYGDFAVLFQSSKIMLLVEDAFKRAGVPYVTVAGKGYYDRPEVWDLLNLLKALYTPADELALASVLRSPLYNLSDDALYGLRLAADQETPRLWDALMAELSAAQPERKMVDFARDSLARLKARTGRVTIAELLSFALEDTAFLATLTGLPDGARRVNNVEKLLDVARRSGQVTLGDFIVYLQDLSDREAREGEAPTETSGAVQLMTVHASKGLEFPVVALFDSTWQVHGSQATLIVDPRIGLVCKVANDADPDAPPDKKWYAPFAFRLAQDRAAERDQFERLRLFYVGATRAQDRLLISGHIGKSLKENSWLDLMDQSLGFSTTDAENQNIAYAWGTLRYSQPNTPPAPDRAATSERSAWDDLKTSTAEPIAPPLLTAPPADPHAPALTLNATELGLLGEAHAQRNRQAERFAQFRQRVLSDAPTSIHEVVDTTGSDRVDKRAIGEIVHQALQWQHVAGDLRAKLESYAWEQGITDPQRLENAIREATDLLAHTAQIPVLQKVQQARQVYREQPFSLRLGDRTISGKIDLLFRDKFGQWTVLDYKTSDVEQDYVAYHARRYYLQIGIYARAVEELTGQVPDTYLHYIRPAVTIRVSETAWRDSLIRMEADLLTALATGQLVEPSETP